MEEDYDFAYEFTRYAESLKEPLRTYRVEFNLSGPSGEVPANSTTSNHFTSTYSTSHFSTSKTNTTNKTVVYDSATDAHIQQNGFVQQTSKATSATTVVDGNRSPASTATSVQFSEIRSLKRSAQQSSATEGGSDASNAATVAGTLDGRILDAVGIRDPQSGRPLTVGQAIQMRILDVRTGQLAINAQGERVDLPEAVRRGLIDAKLAANLLEPGAAIDAAGRPISLLDVIQKEILDAEGGSGRDATQKRIKVTTTSSSSAYSDEQQASIRAGQPAGLSMAAAVAAGVVDSGAGTFRTDNGTLISIAEAYERGYLIRHESVRIKAHSLCLTDAIGQALIEPSNGWLIDRNSGDKFRLDSAIESGLLCADVREVVDAKRDVKVTVREALAAGLLNAKTGRYAQNVTMEKLTLAEARQRQLICKPLTLKDVCDLSMLERSTGLIYSPTRRRRLSITDAIKAGVLDADTVKSITVRPGELVTLGEAIRDGVILADSRYRDLATKEEFSIPDAVDRGLISSVTQKSIFNIDGFRDPHSEEFISLNDALSKQYLCRKSGAFALDTDKGMLKTLDQCVADGFVRPEVYEMLHRPIGVRSPIDSAVELTVIDLVYHDFINPKTGYLLDPKSKAIVPLDKAIESEFITPEGALLLSSLLNITLTTETVTKTVKRYVTITGDLNASSSKMDVEIPTTFKSVATLTFTDAVRRGLIDEAQQLFRDPESGHVHSVQQALNYGLIAPDSDAHSVSADVPKTTSITIVHKSVIPDTITSQSVSSKVSQFIDVERTSSLQTTSVEQSMEVPIEGLYLWQAIESGLFDTKTGMFHIRGTDRLVSFEECIKLKIINPNSVLVLDKNSRKLSVVRSFEKRILDEIGNYRLSSGGIVPMTDAIEQGLIILERLPSDFVASGTRRIKISKSIGQADVIEVSQAGEPLVFDRIKVSSPDLPSPEPVQLAPGIIYDPSTALVIFTESGRSESILIAVREGLVDPSHVQIVDPKSGKPVTFTEAIASGVVDANTGNIVDANGQQVDIISAVKYGLLAVAGNPLVAAAGAINTLRLVFDPKTGEQIPVELAYDRGLLTKVEAAKLVAGMSGSASPSNVGHILHTVQESGTLTADQAQQILAQTGANVVVNIPNTKIDVPLDEALRSGLVSPTRARKLLLSAMTGPSGTIDSGLDQSKFASITRDSDGRPVVLQKMHKRIVRPKDALAAGIIDNETATILDDRVNFMDETGHAITLYESMQLKKINGSAGRIVDPQRSDVLNIAQAIDRGILDAKGTNELLVPLHKSLSLPQVVRQGLFDGSAFIHPESGTGLSLQEALICEIVDPRSCIVEPNGQIVTLASAIDRDVVNVTTIQVKTAKGPIDLLAAVQIRNLFIDESKSLGSMPLIGLTFPVALRRGFIDLASKEFVHPITSERVGISAAIESGLIMVLPYTPSADSVSIDDALQGGLIRSDCTFIDRATNQAIPIAEAIENGRLVIKPLSQLIVSHASAPVTSVTETITSYHTVTTKTIELQSGYALISANEVQDVQTGETFTLEEARSKGIIQTESVDIRDEHSSTIDEKLNFNEAIKRGLLDIRAGTFTDPVSGETVAIQDAVDRGVLTTQASIDDTDDESVEEKVELMTLAEAVESIYDDKSKQFRDPKNPERLVDFAEAVKEGILDGESAVYDVQTGKTHTLAEGIRDGFIDSKTGEVNRESGSKINVREAAKMGLLAVVGAPVLAGMAVAGAVKKAVGSMSADSSPSKQSSEVVVSSLTSKSSVTVKVTSVSNSSVLSEVTEANDFSDSVHNISVLQPLDQITSHSVEITDLSDKSPHNVDEPHVSKEINGISETTDLVHKNSKDSNEKSPLISSPVDAPKLTDVSHVTTVPSSFVDESQSLKTHSNATLIEPTNYDNLAISTLIESQVNEPKSTDVSSIFGDESQSLPIHSDVKLIEATKDNHIEKSSLSASPVIERNLTDVIFSSSFIDEYQSFTTHSDASLIELTKDVNLDESTLSASQVSEPKSTDVSTNIGDESQSLIVHSDATLIEATNDDNIDKSTLSASPFIEPKLTDITHVADADVVHVDTTIDAAEETTLRPNIDPNLSAGNTGVSVESRDSSDKQCETTIPDLSNDNEVGTTSIGLVKEQTLSTGIVTRVSEESISSNDKQQSYDKTLLISSTDTSNVLSTVTISTVEFKLTDDTPVHLDSIRTGNEIKHSENISDLPQESAIDEPSNLIERPFDEQEASTDKIDSVKSPLITSPDDASFSRTNIEIVSDSSALISTHVVESSSIDITEINVADVTSLNTTDTSLNLPNKQNISEEIVHNISSITKDIKIQSSDIDSHSSPVSTVYGSSEKPIPAPRSEFTKSVEHSSNDTLPTADITDAELVIIRNEDETFVQTDTVTHTIENISKDNVDKEFKTKEDHSASKSEIVEIKPSFCEPVHSSIVSASVSRELEITPLFDKSQIESKDSNASKIKEAAKIGLMAVVGAPVLAGMAVADALKKVVCETNTEHVKLSSDNANESISTSIHKFAEVSSTSSKTITSDSYSLESNSVESTSSTAITSVSTVSSATITQTSSTLVSQVISGQSTTITELTAEEEQERSEELDQLDDLPSSSSELIQVNESHKEQSPDKAQLFDFNTVESEQPSSDNLRLGEAITKQLIRTQTCRIVYNGQMLDQTVQVALEQGDINTDDLVEVRNENELVLLDHQSILSFTELLTPEHLAELGVFDPKADCFVDAVNGERISFATFAYEMNIVDPEQIYVKDLSQNVFEPLYEALARPLIDKNTGHMVDSKTGKRVQFFECIKRGWIIQKPESAVSSLQEVDPVTGTIVQFDGSERTISEAINSGQLDVDNMSVRDPRTGEIIPMTLAIERGVVNLKRGVIVNTQTGEEISLVQALAENSLLTGLRKPISLEAVVHQGLFDAQTGRILDTIEQIPVSLVGSISKGIVDPSISLVRDTRSMQLSTLTEALEENLIDGEDGLIRDSATNERYSLNVAIEKDLLSSKTVRWTLVDVLDKQFYNPETGLILQPSSGKELSLRDSISAGTVDISTTLVRDDVLDNILSVTEAIASGLLDADRGRLTKPDVSLDQALQKGLILNTTVPFSLLDLLVRKLYDPLTGLLTIDNQTMSLEDAIAAGLINPNELIVRDPISGNTTSLSSAIRSGVIDAKTGVFSDPHSGLKLTLQEALENGFLVAFTRKSMLPDAVFKGLYDPRSGTFTNSATTERLSTDRAIKRGIIDPQSTIVKVGSQVLPFELAAEQGIVNARRGTVVDEANNIIDFREAFERGILIEVLKPTSLSEALLKGLYDELDGRFMDARSGEKMNIVLALERGLIDRYSVQIKDSKTGKYRDIDLLEATRSGVFTVVDGSPTKVASGTGEQLSLQEAFDTGLLADSKAPISVQRAIHQGLYDDKTGKFHDPLSGRQITLLEATRRFTINPQLPCYFNERDEQMFSLADTCRAKVIDRREGLFREPGSPVFVALNEAMALGLIVDIETAGFGLYETLAMGFYDRAVKQIVHPVSGRKLTLRQACKEDIVSAISTLVKDQSSGKYMPLEEAVSSGLIDDLEGTYVLPQYAIDLQEARQRGLIVTTQKLLSIEKAVKNHLFRPDSGKFIDPSTAVLANLKHAIADGWIDAESTAFKNLETGEQKTLARAIADGDIDVAKGRVLDAKSKRSYNFDVALSNGLLVTLDRPLTGRSRRRESIDLLSASPTTKTPREMSVDDAIRHEIIDPLQAVVKNPATGQFEPLQVRLDAGSVDRTLRCVIDPKALYFAFDPSLIVYQREPLSFDAAIESGNLNLSTGKFSINATSTTTTSITTSSTSSSSSSAITTTTESTNTTTESPTESPTPILLSLKDAIVLGHIDAESALIKDDAKRKLLQLPEAFRKGLVDADKANVLDTSNSKLHSLQAAIERGLLITPKRSIGLLEALSYNLYDPLSGTFVDPFRSTDADAPRHWSLAGAIAAGHIDPSTTVVRDGRSGDGNGAIVPLVAAIANGLVDAEAGRLNDGQSMCDLLKARDRGLLLAAEQRQAVIEKFNLCEDNLSGLLKWIVQVELKIAGVGGPRESIDELRNQINTLKQIKEDIDGQSRPVSACLEQVRQLVLTGGDVLSAPEVTALENSGRELRSRVDRALERTVKLLKKLESARDELSKLRSELDIFAAWLQTARRTLEDKERALSDLTRLSAQAENTRDFVSDVIAHQADLRFISMSAQKFVDESKDYLSVLNDFRTTLPDRLHHVEPLASSESPIRKEVQLVSAQYKDLLHRANALSDRLSGLGGKQREYQDALNKATVWLNGVQPRVSQTLADPIGADPTAVQDQMTEARALHNEFHAQSRLIDNAKQSLDALLRSLNSGQLSPSEITSLERPVEEVADRYKQLLEALGDRCQLLDKALVQSQGVQDALDGLVGWVNQAEDKFKLAFRPASLIKDRLQDQIREHRSLMADLESHTASIESVRSSAEDLMATASNARIAKKIESKLQDVVGRHQRLLEKSLKRGDFLDETLTQLIRFEDDSVHVESELGRLAESLEARELSALPADDLAHRMHELARAKENVRSQYETCVRLGKDLIGQRDVTDTGAVRDRVKSLESQWKELDATLDEKAKLSKQKAEHLGAYEQLKQQVLVWLTSIESRTNALSPVAVDLDAIKRQIDETKPLAKEHRDYATTIDKVNDLGAQYDALIRPDSPTRKRSTYSPIKRVSPLRRMSGDGRSPSPTKAAGGLATVSPLSPGGSSGFGSRRSSQDGFQLADLSPIQQQLNEINNRYSLVGVRLNDRQNELDGLRDEVKRHQDNLRTLATFLDKIQRQVPKETCSSKDEAERCTRAARKVLEEMYERQSLLDSTRAQIKDLLKRKPDVLGADRLRTELEDVAERWRSLNDLCKDRINFSEQLRDFLDTHDNLNGWLSAKERMLTVLGPISSDPRMVQSQVQQVQVLREEFRGQQPQLNHLLEVGQFVLDYVKPTSSEGQSVSGKLTVIQKKWDELVGRLDERAQSLGAAADSSKEFDAGLSRLREALQTISDNLDALPNDRDHQESLRKIENLDRQLEGQRPLLADAEAAAAALCNVLGDPASRADVNARVGVVGKQYQALQKKLDNRKAETEAALRDGRQFGESCARTLGWLASELGTLNDRLLISAHRPTLQHQIDTHEPIYREVMAREHEIIMLLNKGRELQDRPSPLNTDRALQRDLDKIAQQWERLRREAVDRHGRLQTCMEQCKKYGAASEVFVTWLRQAEDKLTTLRPGVLRKTQLDQQLKELQAFRSEVWKRSGEYDNTKGQGDAFLLACDVDKEPVKAELQDMRERWEKLNNDLLSHAQTLEICARRLGDFTEELRDLDHAVGRCEDRLGAHDALGGAAKDPKLLDRVKTIREDASGLKKPLQNLRKLANEIGSETRAAGGDAEHLTNDVEAIAERIDDLHARLDDRCGELQSAATAVTQFNEQVKGLALDLADLENAVEKLTPPAREVKVVLAQLDDTAHVLDKIDRMADQVADVERAGQVLVDSGFSPDTLQTREQIAGLRKTLGRLDNRAKDHDDTLQKTLKALQEFYDLQSGAVDDLDEVRAELRNMKPVGSELDQIRNQQEDMRRFRTRTVEPLATAVAEVNRLGQDLVRSALGGVSTAVLEKDLERLNEQWNDLKDKLNERERRLDVALLQSGKFQEALDGLAKWLSDTEEMVDNQKPPSADYKVVKAQLQEQKFLKKLLLDRQNSMSSLFQLGKDVAANCDPTEKQAIEGQLKELMGRFDALTDGAEKRTADLEQAMQVAKQFHDKLVPLANWLDGAEKSVKNMELVPTDEEMIQQRIREHNALHDEILDKKPDFSELADIAGQLMELVGDDEAVGLGEKVKGITERYTSLVDASDNVGQLLAESRQGLRHLVLTYQELVGWMEGMDLRLQRYRVVPVHTDKLLEQMDVLVDLNEDIASKAPNVDSTVETGLELMKHITADEAIQLKDKLDSIQRRYGELTNKGGDLLKNTQEALPIVQKFHDAHNRLVEWMQGAEGALASGEPRESDILRLEGELSEMRPVLETVNQIGPALCQVSPGEGAATIESLVSRDNRRFDAIVEQIQRKAERLHLSKQRSKEVTGDLDELLEWFRDMDASLREADLPGIEPKLVRAQLQEHRSINDDVSSQKGRVRDVTASAKKVLRESQPNENTAVLREKLEDLKEVVDTVASLCANRLSVLEQALPLSEHFADSHQAIAAWLDDMENQIAALTMPALRPDQIALQQDKNERLVQSISEHKPLLDKLNKTGEALAALVAEDDAAKVSDILDQDNARYAALKAELRERQQALDDALQESSQFSDKLEGMLRALTNTADQVNQADPISAHPPKIRDQIEDNAALVDDLDKRSEAFAAVKRAANDVIAKAGNSSDPAVRDIKKKLEKLNNLWNDLTKATSKRGGSLEDALGAAEKFWRQLQAIMDTLNDLEETLSSQEPAAAQPQEIQKQQVALQEIRQEIDQTKPEVEEVRRTGTNLMQLCGEPDKPEVKKHIEDLDHAWDNITALYAKREENLIDAMEKAMEFHETLQNLLAFLAKAEDRFVHLGPIGSDIDAVKRQIEQLKRFKDDVDPHMVEVEALNRQAIELTERTSPEQASAIREPLNAVNRRWETLLRGMVDRQKQLEHALLHLGQFQHALNELLVWINKTDATLDQLKPIPGDPQLLEVELAKLKVLANDIQAHQSSVDTLNDAGRQLIETDRGSVEASTTQEKLKKLNVQWKDLLQKAADRQHELEESLRDAQAFVAEVQDILGWLGDVDSIIGASKPVGGLPETASEQLERFMEIYNELEENRPKVETLQAQGQEYIKRQGQLKVPSSNLQHTLRTLKQRWDAVVARASDKKIKLEIALKEATEFHDALQAFVDWLTSAEKQLAGATAVSRVLETIQFQIEEHKILQKDVSVHREAMLLLDKKGTHLKYFSQKQDVILIKNLLVSVQHRWERVVAKAAERTRSLDHGYKEAREFHEAWQTLLNWLQETESGLDSLAEEAAAVNDPAKIKRHLDRLKETQRQLSGRQGQYDTTMRTGKNLTDRAPKSDESTLNRMLGDLKDAWTRVCAKSVDRQRKLEEALLFSGQFSEALQALLEWLRKTKAGLAAEGPVHGDLETVTQLVDQHKHLESDLEKRAGQMQHVLQSGRELERSGDTKDISRHLNELQELWGDVTDLSERRGQRLLEALRDAERLHKQVHMLLEWLSEAEQKLRFASSMPDDEAHARELLHLHSRFMSELQEKEHDKDDTLQLAHSILSHAYPDAVPIIKNWITIIQSRWDEVSQWALSRESKLQSQLQSLRDLDDTIEELLAWLSGLEATLLNLESEPLPEEISVVEQLIADHKEFMENTARRQPEVDRACKPKTQPAGTKDARKPSRSTKTPVRGSAQDLRENSPDYGRKQSFKGSRDHGLNNRRPSRASPTRDTPDRERLPHYGPRFSPPSTVSDVEFRSPRAHQLWDKWRYVWMLAWERQRRLHEHLMYLQDVERVRQFSWDDWRKRFLKFMNHKKSRLTDLFRKMDKDNNGLIPRDIFIDGIINTKFDTSRMEMGAVADLFDRNGEGLIDWQEFIAALRPDWQERKPANDADKIHDEVKRLVMLCTCRQKFRVFQVGEGKYRFGDSQKLRLVRILRSTVMVRVGGGWVALDEFLVKNDPCRAKGRTNIELREQFILADGVSQSMAAFKPRTSVSSGSHPNGSHAGSPINSQGPITKVRERSQRSVAMSRPSRSSLSASTPDSLSDNESNSIGGGGVIGSGATGPTAASTSRYTPRKPSYTPSRTGLTPGGSRNGSKPNSRPLSRAGSKPPSRHGSTLSLDSTDDLTPTRIPQRRLLGATTPTASSAAARPSRLSVGSTITRVSNGNTGLSAFGSTISRPRTPSGSASPAPTRRNQSGTSTPSGMQTPRRTSTEPASGIPSGRKSRGTTPIGQREPFRL